MGILDLSHALSLREHDQTYYTSVDDITDDEQYSDFESTHGSKTLGISQFPWTTAIR